MKSFQMNLRISLLVVSFILIFGVVQVIGQDNPILVIEGNDWKSVQWSSDGSSIILADGEKIQILDTQFNLIDQIDIGIFQDIALSPDGSLIAILRWNSVIELWDTNNWEYLRQLPQQNMRIILFKWHPESNAIATLQVNSNSIQIWDTTVTTIVQTIEVESSEPLAVFDWSPDGSQMAIGHRRNSIVVWDLAQAQVVATFQQHQDMISDVAWSPDGRWIASSGVSTNCHSVSEAFIVWVWDSQNGEPFQSFDTLHCSLQNPLTWSADSKYLASTTETGLAPLYSWRTFLQLWEIESGSFVSRKEISHRDSVVNLTWQPTGNNILFRTSYSGVGGFSNVCASPFIGIIDTINDEILDYKPSHHSGNIFDIKWHPHKDLMASAGSDRNIYIWNSQTGELNTILKKHPCTITHLAWNPTTNHLVSTGKSGIVFLWDVDSKSILNTSEFWWSNVEYSQKFIWNIDGSRLLAFDYDGRGQVWDQKLNSLYSFQLPLEIPFAVLNSVTWDDTTPLIAIGSNPIQIWSAIEEPVVAWTFTESVSNPLEIQWSPDGTLLASYNEDNSIDIWDARGTLLHTLSLTHELNSFFWCPNAECLAISDSISIFVYGVGNEELINTFEISGGLLRWNSDATRLVGVQGSTIQIWETEITP